MKITFLCVGGIKKAYIREGFGDYAGRLGRYAPFELVEVKDCPASAGTPIEEVLRKEGERILDKVRRADIVIAMSERGKSYTSKGLAAFLSDAMSGGVKGITFIVGGAYGLHDSVAAAARFEISLSAMTLPHEMARLFLAEQVYRAFTIIKGEPYSH